MPSDNEAVIAAAGSGKTKRLVDEALADPSTSTLITTYTRDNLAEIEDRLWRDAGATPHNVTTMTWFEFLLRDGVKPYQGFKTDILSLRSINFDNKPFQYANENEFNRYYVDGANNVYQDRVAALACKLDDLSGGRVVARIAECFDLILIDEIQDLAGYDLELLVRLLKSGARVLAVGDPRQSVYMTNYSAKNSSLRRVAIVEWLEKQQADGLLTVSSLTDSFRCSQVICDYADALYPDLPKTTGQNNARVIYAGIHLVHIDDLDKYREVCSPQELQWNKRNKLASSSALNFGQVKGATFDRVLIHPTGTFTGYVESGKDLKQGTRAKFYVALTRARHSVGIVTTSRTTKSKLDYWSP